MELEGARQGRGLGRRFGVRETNRGPAGASRPRLAADDESSRLRSDVCPPTHRPIITFVLPPKAK